MYVLQSQQRLGLPTVTVAARVLCVLASMHKLSRTTVTLATPRVNEADTNWNFLGVHCAIIPLIILHHEM